MKLEFVGGQTFILKAESVEDRTTLELLYTSCGGPGGSLRILRSSEELGKKEGWKMTEIEFTPYRR